MSQWVFENPRSVEKVSSKFWDHSQTVHSWREGISFCMYKFEKVTRGADRHERTWEPSRDRRSVEKIRKRSGEMRVLCPDIFLTLEVSRDVCILYCACHCVYLHFLAYSHVQYLSVTHEAREKSTSGSKWTDRKINLLLCLTGVVFSLISLGDTLWTMIDLKKKCFPDK